MIEWRERDPAYPNDGLEADMGGYLLQVWLSLHQTTPKRQEEKGDRVPWMTR